MAKRKRQKGLDYILLFTVVALLLIGLMMVYSSTFHMGYEWYGQSAYFLFKQLVWGAIGLVALAAMARLDYHSWRRFSIPIMAGTLLLLIAVLFVGESRLGASSWFLSGSGQPSELCKLALIIYMADWLSSKGEQIHEVSYGLVPFAILVGVMTGLIVIQPDFGTAFIIVFTAVSMFFIAGAKLWQLAISSVVSGLAFALLITQFPHALERIENFIHSFSDPYGESSSYHLQQALHALISGGIFGRGPGGSYQKFYLYAPHTDSIFAVLAEDLGLIGCLTVLGLFAALAYRGFKIAREAPDNFGTILATGITCCLIFQALMNMAVITAAVPFTGITLPFISYGGSSLMVSLASVGLLLSIYKGPPKKESKENARYDLGWRYWRPRISRTRRR